MGNNSSTPSPTLERCLATLNPDGHIPGVSWGNTPQSEIDFWSANNCSELMKQKCEKGNVPQSILYGYDYCKTFVPYPPSPALERCLATLKPGGHIPGLSWGNIPQSEIDYWSDNNCGELMKETCEKKNVFPSVRYGYDYCRTFVPPAPSTDQTPARSASKWTDYTNCNDYGLYGAKSCPPDREYKDGLCYLRPREGFRCDVTACFSGTAEYQTGTVKDNCPAGHRNVASICWPDCPEGYSDGGVFCNKPIIERICNDTNFPRLIDGKCVKNNPMDIIIPANNLPVSNATYDSMANFCTLQGKRLCNKNELCNGNVPKSDVQFSNTDSWVAIGDSKNEWLLLNQCKTHTEVAGDKPSWGLESTQRAFDRGGKCC